MVGMEYKTRPPIWTIFMGVKKPMTVLSSRKMTSKCYTYMYKFILFDLIDSIYGLSCML